MITKIEDGKMKRITTIVCLLCGFSATAQTLTEAVGINTENPQGVLHIDGGATASEASDDVLIDANGSLGAGVASPAAKVDLSAAAEGGALRIADGTQGNGKVLTSDADGAARWTTLSDGVWWYAALANRPSHNVSAGPAQPYPLTGYGSGFISSGGQGSYDTENGTITVPSKGIYRITFSKHYNYPGVQPYWATSELQVNGISRWTPSTWGAMRGSGTFPTYTAILNLEANDELQFVLLREEAFSAPQEISVPFFMVELLQSIQ
jgi:hypothetical protein